MSPDVRALQNAAGFVESVRRRTQEREMVGDRLAGMAAAFENADLERRMRMQQANDFGGRVTARAPDVNARHRANSGASSSRLSDAICARTSSGAVEPIVRFAATEPRASSSCLEWAAVAFRARDLGADARMCLARRRPLRLRADRRGRSRSCNRSAPCASMRSRTKPTDSQARAKASSPPAHPPQSRSFEPSSPAGRAGTTARVRRAWRARRRTIRSAARRARARARTGRGCASAASSSSRLRRRRRAERNRMPAPTTRSAPRRCATHQ